MKKAIRTYSNDQQLVANRREHIARCAARLFMKRGYKQTTVREIADACGMGTGTLYYYVGSKEDILHLVIDSASVAANEVLNSFPRDFHTISATEALRQAIASLYKGMDDLQDVCMLIYRETEHLSPAAQQTAFDIEINALAAIEQLLNRGCETGEFRIDDVKLAAHNIMVLAEAWAVKRWFLRRHHKLEEHIEKQAEFMLRAISANTKA